MTQARAELRVCLMYLRAATFEWWPQIWTLPGKLTALKCLVGAGKATV